MAASNISCQWTSAVAVVSSINEHGLNVSDIVSKCDGICKLVFEPDGQTGVVTGPGFLVGYFLQIAFFCLFGLILPVLVKIVDCCSQAKGRQLFPLLRLAQQFFYCVTTLFSGSIMLAGLFRFLLHRPSGTEFEFIKSMFRTQAYLLLAAAISSLQLGEWATVEWLLSLNIFVAAVVAFLSGSLLDPYPRAIYSDLARQCESQRGFVTLVNKFQGLGITDLKLLSVPFGYGFVAGFVSTAFVVFIWEHSKLVKRIIGKLPGIVKLKTNFLSILVLTAFSAQIMNTVRQIYLSEGTRKRFKEIVGDHYRVDWNYTQALPILLWVWFCYMIVMASIDYHEGECLCYQRIHFKKKRPLDDDNLDEEKGLLDDLGGTDMSEKMEK